MQTKIKISNWYCILVGKFGEFGISSVICQTKVFYTHQLFCQYLIKTPAFYLRTKAPGIRHGKADKE